MGLVFRSVGYKGVPLPDVPFHESWGVILNDKGRVLDPETKQPIVGEYTAGWIKRGPTGVIGTNKPDALETVECMMEDLAAGRHLDPAEPHAQPGERLIRERQPKHFTYQDWLKLNELEVGLGRSNGPPSREVHARRRHERSPRALLIPGLVSLAGRRASPPGAREGSPGGPRRRFNPAMSPRRLPSGAASRSGRPCQLLGPCRQD